MAGLGQNTARSDTVSPNAILGLTMMHIVIGDIVMKHIVIWLGDRPKKQGNGVAKTPCPG